MPQFGPNPKQFSQAGANPGEPITASPLADPVKDAPSYKSEPREFYLNQGVFGNPSDETKVNGDTNFPEFMVDFDALDVITGLDDGQSLTIAYQGRLAVLETRLESLSIFVKGDIATSTGPPQFRLRLWVEGPGLAFVGPLTDAPSSSAEFTITADIDFAAQPTNFKRYFLTIEANVSMGQTLQCSRPFVRQE